jgi:hypothetical protein
MTRKRNPGPFLKSFFIPDSKIEATAKLQLESLKLMPSAPGPVAVEKYCERRWGFPEDYLVLDHGVLGCAAFSENGIEAIAISRELGDDTSRIGIVRTRSTLAHEIGHGELRPMHTLPRSATTVSKAIFLVGITNQEQRKSFVATSRSVGQAWMNGGKSKPIASWSPLFCQSTYFVR